MPEVAIRRVVSEDEYALLLKPKDDLIVREVSARNSGNGLGESSGGSPSRSSSSSGEHGDGKHGDGELREFDSAEGAFRHYRRTLRATPLPSTTIPPSTTTYPSRHYEIKETTSFRLSIPFWSFALNLLVKRELRRPRLGDAEETAPRQLWWMPSQRLDERSGHVLGVLCLISLVTGYLGVLLSQTLTFVADEFNADKGTQGIVLSAVRLGVPLAFGITFLADRFGRQPLLRIGLVGAYLTTALTAASVGIWMFGISQGVARGLITAAALLIGIIAAEEMPAGARAYAASILSMCAGLGAGVMVWFIWIADFSLWAWRFLYLIPLLAAPGLVWMLRALPETRRYEILQSGAATLDSTDLVATTTTFAHPGHLDETPSQSITPDPANIDHSSTTSSQTDASPPSDIQPHSPIKLSATATSHSATSDPLDCRYKPPFQPTSMDPSNPVTNPELPNPDIQQFQRLLLLGGTLFLLSIFTTPASQFLNEYLRDERDFSGVHLVAFQLFTNTPAGISLYLAGRWADRRGRRQIAMVALLGMTIFTALKFSAAGWPMWGWGLGGSVFAAAMVPIIGVYGPELFATSQRGRSNGILTVIGVAGGALGLLLVGQLAERWDSFGQVFTIVSAAPILVIALVFFMFPETARKELETLNPTDKAPD